MTLNIFFENFIESDFNSKNSKNNIKKFIRNNINLENISDFNKIKLNIIEKYLQNNNVDINIDLNYKLENNNLKLFIDKKNKNKEELRKKLKQKINNKFNNFENKKKMNMINEKLNKISKTNTKKENKIDNDIISFYNKSKEIFPNTPLPKNVLSNKKIYIDEIFKHLFYLYEKFNDTNKIIYLMDNDYINYLQKCCNFDYKLYLTKFIEKIENNNKKKKNNMDLLQKLKSDELNDYVIID